MRAWPRLAHAMNFDMQDTVQLGLRAGAVGGLSAHAMAQFGMVLVWYTLRDASSP